LFYPFQLFGTFIHELGHGLAAIATGGEFRRFAVNPDLSGHALAAGGVGWIIAGAGYVGSAVFGGLLTVISARGVPARQALLWLGVIFGLLCLLFVRNLFGLFTGAALAVGLVFAAQRLRERWADALLLFLAVQMMLNSLNSVFDLVQISAASRALTDAEIMARATGIPAIIWALVWSAISIGVLVVSLRVAYQRGPTKTAQSVVV
jgi:hypothetical protein